MAFLHLSAFRASSRAAIPLPTTASSRPSLPAVQIRALNRFDNWVDDFRSKSLSLVLSGALTLGLSLSGQFCFILLPQRFLFLVATKERRLTQEIAEIEKETGFKLRVLAQNYPDTPGLAIRDFWQVDDRTVVFVADPTFGNILNFNVGASVDLDIPRSFWSRLAGKYGNIFYWKEKGEDASIEAAVMAISSCLREPVGANNCSEVK
ncbi:unnamed protein product [Linum tenue]|uniref:Thylakoid lumenal 15.0 kDa protein 2, chloroplastic n=1 Tax=Linum tenue TaxID=586396 RepID=A0AAV0PJH6_9ROSI|nr:unnamed protein product [Linum tenue]CAI0472299.1 unnamed protein product [Linum tenue]